MGTGLAITNEERGKGEVRREAGNIQVKLSDISEFVWKLIY